MAWYDSSSYLEVRFFVKERKCFNARERRKERTTNDKSVSGSRKIIYKNMERPVDTLIVNYFANPLFTTGSLFFFARARGHFSIEQTEPVCNSLFQTSTSNLGRLFRAIKNRSRQFIPNLSTRNSLFENYVYNFAVRNN